MTIVTRFPPSPTGLMHIGTARTCCSITGSMHVANGKVVFRIEDTDRERYDLAHVDALINGVKWLGLDYDGDVVSSSNAATATPPSRTNSEIRQSLLLLLLHSEEPDAMRCSAALCDESGPSRELFSKTRRPQSCKALSLRKGSISSFGFIRLFLFKYL